MIIVTPDQLEQALRDMPINGTARRCSIWTVTTPKLNKKHRVTGQLLIEVYPMGLEKKTKRGGFIGAKYASVVNRQRQHEEANDITDLGDPLPMFNAQSLWKGKGEYVPGSDILVRHTVTGQVYLAFLPDKGREDDHVKASYESTIYCLATGSVVEDAELTGWKPPPSKNKSQGVKYDRPWNTIKIENVKQVRCGEDYVVEPDQVLVA